MKGKDIFTGMKLSEQTRPHPVGTDQRLFGPSTATPSLTAPTPSPTATEPPHQPEPVVANVAPAPTVEPPAALPPSSSERTDASPARFVFDPAALPHRKDSFLFTTEEFEALEDIKLEVGRALDIKATKQNLVRCAVAHLIDDWRRKGVASPVIAPLKRTGR